MLSASKLPLDIKLSREELNMASPYMEMYSIIMRCKNLGIQPSLESLSVDDLELIHEFYNQYELTRSKVK